MKETLQPLGGKDVRAFARDQLDFIKDSEYDRFFELIEQGEFGVLACETHALSVRLNILTRLLDAQERNIHVMALDEFIIGTYRAMQASRAGSAILEQKAQ